MYALFADSVLVLHVVVVVFIVGGLGLVVAGNFAGWTWANNSWFRFAHLSAIAIVVAESLLGFTCPLTTLEMTLRSETGSATYAEGFIEHWLHWLLYYDAPPWVFTLVYSLFGLTVLIVWWCFPPRMTARR